MKFPTVNKIASVEFVIALYPVQVTLRSRSSVHILAIIKRIDCKIIVPFQITGRFYQISDIVSTLSGEDVLLVSIRLTSVEVRSLENDSGVVKNEIDGAVDIVFLVELSELRDEWTENV
ncbi:hypothetical protein L6452_26038 [Arctium lappa]|uniref:Uncharacterized protein n=1 Tax=Arctium lappa TaxID=4217 RepID=A0ACB9ABV1_ARCLA|nr:hypothetical protein L6452_26038 [Arctium lappa]